MPRVIAVNSKPLEDEGRAEIMTSRILRIDCSPKGDAAHSWRLAGELTERLLAVRPGATLIHRVLAEQPLDLVDHGFARAMTTHQTAEAAAGVAALGLSEVLIQELETTQAFVLGTPMHNFTVPAALKAWIDQVVRFGRSFKSTPDGKIGLLADRPSYIVIASGGYFTGERARQPDHLTPYLKDILPTIGIKNLEFILLEGLSRGDEAVEEAYATARRRIVELFGG